LEKKDFPWRFPVHGVQAGFRNHGGGYVGWFNTLKLEVRVAAKG